MIGKYKQATGEDKHHLDNSFKEEGDRDDEHSEEIQKILSSDMGNVQRWGIPLLLAVTVVCAMLLHFIKIPIADSPKGSMRLIVLLIHSL